MIKEGAQRALARLPELHPYRVESPTTLRVSWNSTSTAALCENLPGIKRVASRDIEYTSNNYSEIYRLLRVLLALAASVAALPYSYD